ncbi:MAG: D-alanine--D-alanine ligase [bacterium]|nr:D-alanine--D-alanine ligase [bacterium]
MNKVTVGVLRGGPSSEYEVSLKTGAAVLKHLPKQYRKVDVLIDKQGGWHVNGLPLPPERLSRKIDVAFNALHGYYGEDGKVQKMLEMFGIPYTGSDAMSSAVGMNKLLSKKSFKKHRIKILKHKIIRPTDDLYGAVTKVFRTLPQPSVAKPLSGGSSVGVTIARTFHELLEAVDRAFQYDSSVLVEEYVKGREATCGVIDRFRGEAHYALPPIEIIPPPTHDFFNYDAKYSGVTRELCPSNFSMREKKEIMALAIAAHRAIGARHYSRSDFIVSPRGIFILEINTLPGLTEESLLPKACSAVGCSFPDLLDHLITLALERK